MKRTLLLIFILVLSLQFFACSSNKESKVNVIPGSGSANSSLMVGFNELCKGQVEFFTLNSKLIVQEKSSSGITINKVDLTTKKTEKLLSIPDSNYTTFYSKDGSKAIFNNTLVDIPTGQIKKLPSITIPKPQQVAETPDLPSFMFDDNNKVLFINPAYYATKYYFNLSPATLKKLQIPIFNELKNITQPKLDYIKYPEIVLSELKTLFIGYKTGSDSAPLYAFDLFQKKFVSIDTGTVSFSISPDKRYAVYIKKVTNNPINYKLNIVDLQTYAKRELAELQNVNSLTWSPDSNWIAYSGGKANESDIWITKVNVPLTEQLTHNINSIGKLAWSPDGSKLAISSSDKVTSSENKIYIITLNIQMEHTQDNKSTLDPAKEQLSNQVQQLLRQETKELLGAIE